MDLNKFKGPYALNEISKACPYKRVINYYVFKDSNIYIDYKQARLMEQSRITELMPRETIN